MNPKQAKLEQVSTRWKVYNNTLNELETDRKYLAQSIREAHKLHATQQQIADQTRLSRQRIQQLLKENA